LASYLPHQKILKDKLHFLIIGMIIAAKELEKSMICNLQITPLATKLLAINIEK
jgi:hypothetical protein